jgi:hypothetical protein
MHGILTHICSTEIERKTNSRTEDDIIDQSIYEHKYHQVLPVMHQPNVIQPAITFHIQGTHCSGCDHSYSMPSFNHQDGQPPDCPANTKRRSIDVDTTLIKNTKKACNEQGNEVHSANRNTPRVLKFIERSSKKDENMLVPPKYY